MKEKETKHIAAFRKTKLRSGETIELFLDGWIGEMMGKGEKKQHNGMFILTDKRACFYRKGLLGEVLETIPFPKLTSVETLSLMGYRVLRLHTSHDELAFKTFEDKITFDRVYDRLEALRDDEDKASKEGGGSLAEDPIEKIQKLAKLRDIGILSEEEFEMKKSELLSRM